MGDKLAVLSNGKVLNAVLQKDVYHLRCNLSVSTIKPTGTKQISIASNGTVTEDVTDYADIEINTEVPASEVDTGTKRINSNGAHDVVGYASADVNVPNSYSQSDEGKVVSNGSLVSQTSGTVTENGTVDTTLIDELTVNVPTGGGGLDINDIATKSEPTGALTLSTATLIKPYVFYQCTGLTSLSAPNVTSVGNYGFQGCTGLTNINLPELTSIGQGGFHGCTNLVGTIFPKVTSLGNLAFQLCKSGGGNWVFPKVSKIPSDCFRESKLDALDCGKNCARLESRALYYTTGGYIPILILRRTEGVVVAADSSAINKINSTSKVYVPQALIEDYKVASNWSTKGDIFYAIEGSQYENYYADGTEIKS